jgi:hypothetical protein
MAGADGTASGGTRKRARGRYANAGRSGVADKVRDASIMGTD